MPTLTLSHVFYSPAGISAWRHYDGFGSCRRSKFYYKEDDTPPCHPENQLYRVNDGWKNNCKRSGRGPEAGATRAGWESSCCDTGGRGFRKGGNVSSGGEFHECRTDLHVH